MNEFCITDFQKRTPHRHRRDLGRLSPLDSLEPSTFLKNTQNSLSQGGLNINKPLQIF